MRRVAGGLLQGRRELFAGFQKIMIGIFIRGVRDELDDPITDLGPPAKISQGVRLHITGQPGIFFRVGGVEIRIGGQKTVLCEDRRVLGAREDLGAFFQDLVGKFLKRLGVVILLDKNTRLDPVPYLERRGKRSGKTQKKDPLKIPAGPEDLMARVKGPHFSHPGKKYFALFRVQSGAQKRTVFEHARTNDSDHFNIL